jgi:rare lipoprotein A (peptidoglycan hydrolase)
VLPIQIIIMKRFTGIFILLLVSSLFSNMSTNAGTCNWPPHFIALKKTTTAAKEDTDSKGNIITGLATYYAKKFEGGHTATGEIFHHSKFTAASNLFDLNTWVRVTNILTGQSIVVRINDRMHPSMSKKGRVLDLTFTAAKQLQIINRGVAKVTVEAIQDEDLAAK